MADKEPAFVTSVIYSYNDQLSWNKKIHKSFLFLNNMSDCI